MAKPELMAVGADIYSCPICDWKHTEPHRYVEPGVLAGAFGTGVMAMVAEDQKRHRIEAALKAHLDTHPIVKWVMEVRHRDARIVKLEHETAEDMDRMEQAAISVENLTTECNRYAAVLRECRKYLNRSSREAIHSGSILHRQIQEALKATASAPTEPEVHRAD